MALVPFRPVPSLPHPFMPWDIADLRCLQSETAAKMDPTLPGETLSRLLKGHLGPRYESAIGVLWEKADGEH